MPLDRLRRIYSLAGAMLVGEWSADAVKAGLGRSTGGRRVPGLAERALTAFESKPAYGTLVSFLRADAGLGRALARASAPAAVLSARPSPRRLSRMGDLPARLGGIIIPKIGTEAALAAWCGVGPGRLRWLADVTGRNRRHPPGPLRTYRYRWVARREGIPRLLEIPKENLKQLQQKSWPRSSTRSRSTRVSTASAPVGPSSPTPPSTVGNRSSCDST